MILCMEQDWKNLGLALGGSFTARARGIVSPELSLLTPDGEPFGRLTPAGDGGTRLRTGDLEARIGPRSEGRYTMTSGGEEILAAEPVGSATVLSLKSDNRTYEARASLLRGEAVARRAGEVARISGNITNRRHRATFDPEDPASLPIAVFLLNHLFTLRSRTIRAGEGR